MTGADYGVVRRFGDGRNADVPGITLAQRGKASSRSP
jgi:hypothetical protein